jgi:5,10-methylenetetrahydromethanopterin reductase
MRIGFALSTSLSFSAQVNLARTLDERGLSIWIPDERFFRDVFVLMSAVAAATKNSTIGTGVTDPHIRHPLLTATAVASVNELAEGRAILGLGAGISGFDALGIKRKAPAVAMRETIDVARKFWAGETIHFEGRHMQAFGAHLHFPAKPAPIYVAGRGPQVLALGGELGDGVIIGHFTSDKGIDFSVKQIDIGKAKRAPAMKPPELALWAYTSVSRDGDAARRAVKPAIGRTIRSTPEALDVFGVPAPGLLDEIAKFGYARSQAYDEAMWKAVPDELTDHLSIAGTPEDCVKRLKAIKACGVEHVIALPYPAAGMNPVEMVDLFLSDVLPHVQAL